MAVNMLEKLFEHNRWANQQIIRACLALTDDQLDAKPPSATYGSIRSVLIHLVAAQQGYLRAFTTPLEQRLGPVVVEFADIEASEQASGEALIALTRDASLSERTTFQTRDNHYVEPWVLIVQAINHATEHREQIKSMLTALGVTPPDIDGWDYGTVTHALVPIEK